MKIPIVDYYAVLGVHTSAEDVVIRAAYKALAQRYHPDRFTGSKDEAHRKMSELSKAYEVLADPMRRPKYDRRRQFANAPSIATGVNGSARYPSPALAPPKVVHAVEARRKRSRAAVATLMVVVGLLSAFNLFHYSPRLKEWLGVDTAATPSLPIRHGSASVAETPIPEGEPLPLLLAEPAATPPATVTPGREPPRAGAKSASVNHPVKSAPAAVDAVRTKPEAKPPKTCSQQELLLGLCS